MEKKQMYITEEQKQRLTEFINDWTNWVEDDNKCRHIQNELQAKRKRAARENFLASVDTDIPISVHLKNAVKQSNIYDWDRATVGEIFASIEDIYNQNNERKRRDK